MYEKKELEEFERLWILFASCLDVLHSQMFKTLTLVRIFHLHAGKSYTFL